jgi:hypothetical protein
MEPMPKIRAQNQTTKTRPRARGEGRTFQEFMSDVERLLGGVAGSKGYSRNGPDGFNELYTFVQAMNAGGHQHALGEIVYKARRFAAKQHVEDITKIAAWAFLVWKHVE